MNKRGMVAAAAILFGLGAVAPADAAASAPHSHKAAASKPKPAPQSLQQQFFAKLDAGDADAAHQLAQKIGDRLIIKYERWAELSRGLAPASFAEISVFIRDNPDWPGQSGLKRQAEQSLMLEGTNTTIISWFVDHQPQTREGKLKLGDALRAAGRVEEGNALIRRSWVEDTYSATDEKLFFDKYGDIILAPDHILRIDRLLWRGQDDAVRRQMRHVSDDVQALAEARLRLQADNGGVDAALAKVPPRLREDPGLLYDRLRWARDKSNDAQAQEILLKPPPELIRPDLWWDEREIQVRHVIDDGNGDLAYKLASQHGLSGGSDYAQAEFLSGWVALRMLKKPDMALQHFDAVYHSAKYPTTQSRGAYWAARAAEETGDTVAATDWYIKSAENITTFYGQLAAAKLGAPELIHLPAEPTPTPDDKASFAKRDVVKLVEKLVQLGAPERIDPFVLRLAEQAGTGGNAVLVADLAKASGRLDLAVQVARKVQRDGIVLVDSGYPVLSQGGRHDDATELALVHALIRQESGFNSGAVSKAGAQGLMQLMPATAKAIAGKIGLPFAQARLTKDANYNVEIGRAFIGNVLSSFSGSYVLSIAAYNAGPGRVRQWLREMGDPRDGKLEAVDWIEMVPYSETRNYIQRVLEGLQVYRLRLNHGAGSPRFGSFASAPEAGSPWCLIACTAAAATPPAGHLD